MEIIDTTNKNKCCPLSFIGENIAIDCFGSECAWWVEVNDLKFGSSSRKIGRCAITQLAMEINPNRVRKITGFS